MTHDAPSPSSFPRTRVSIVEQLQNPDPDARREAFGRLVTGYWKPVYKYIRLRWHRHPEDAEDLTQGFLLTSFERDYLARFDSERARFRTFLRVCLDRYIMNADKGARARKRGGGRLVVSLDFTGAESEMRGHEPADPADTDAYFRQEFLRDLFSRTVRDVREDALAAGRDRQWRVFERYDLGPAERRTYADVAGELGLTVSQVTNDLAALRRTFRARLLTNLRDACGSEEEFRDEARELLGLDVA